MKPADYDKLWAELETLYFLPLIKGKFSVIDGADAPNVSHHKWTMGSGYAFRKSGKSKVGLHQMIIGGQAPDHKNNIRTDNRRCNLRRATCTQNNQNRRGWCKSGFKGVHIDRKEFRVVLILHGRRIYLGKHKDPAKAARLYDLLALKHFGEFARLNFPERINEYREALAAVA